MQMSNEKRLDQRHRLLAMREHLRVRATPDEAVFDFEVVAACVKKVQSIVNEHADSSGEVIVAAIAASLGVRFEEVKTSADIDLLEQKYLVEKRELGFGLLAKELADPLVDALLFQRANAAHDAPDRWVAVINLQQTEARGYWNRPHELVHRLAEPPQQRLPFFRHRSDTENRVERIMDLGAAELAFPRMAFGPHVDRVTRHDLSWTLVKAVQRQFAPTSSLLASAKAFLKHWPQPAFLLRAEMRGRKGDPGNGVALRVSLDGFTSSTDWSGVRFFPNMRVPVTSPIRRAHESVREETDYENLGNWTTSAGSALPGRRALTSGIRLGPVTYGLVSLT